MVSLEPQLKQTIQTTLLKTSYFETDSELKALFIDQRVNLWANRLPSANNQLSRVEQVMNYLYGQKNSQGENGLGLLLMVLRDQHHVNDSLYKELQQLAEQLTQQSNSPTTPNQPTHEESVSASPNVSIKVGHVGGNFTGNLAAGDIHQTIYQQTPTPHPQGETTMSDQDEDRAGIHIHSIGDNFGGNLGYFRDVRQGAEISWPSIVIGIVGLIIAAITCAATLTMVPDTFWQAIF